MDWSAAVKQIKRLGTEKSKVRIPNQPVSLVVDSNSKSAGVTILSIVIANSPFPLVVSPDGYGV